MHYDIRVPPDRGSKVGVLLVSQRVMLPALFGVAFDDKVVCGF